MAVTALPDLNILTAEALRALILSQHEQLLSREREIEHLQLLLAKLHRMQFGRKSEKVQRQIEQLELRLEELESNRSEKESKRSEAGPVTIASTTTCTTRPLALTQSIAYSVIEQRHHARFCCRSYPFNCFSA